MNMMLHGIGGDELPLVVADSLAGDPGDRYEIVMTNPPFGKKSSTTIVADDGKVARETEIIERDDFWATTSNKQQLSSARQNPAETKRSCGDRRP